MSLTGTLSVMLQLVGIDAYGVSRSGPPIPLIGYQRTNAVGNSFQWALAIGNNTLGIPTGASAIVLVAGPGDATVLTAEGATGGDFNPPAAGSAYSGFHAQSLVSGQTVIVVGASGSTTIEGWWL